MIWILLPFPPKELSPNSRTGWRKKAEIFSEAKNDGYISAHEQVMTFAEEGVPTWIDGDLRARLVFKAPDRRKRDLDNLLSACKAYIDGVCQHLEIDDSQIKEYVITWGTKSKAGQVILRIEEL